MQRVTFIALYDEYCLGVRYMSSILQNEGHHVDIVVFKGVASILPSDVPPPERREEGGYYSMCTYTSPKELQLLLDVLKKQDPHLVGLSFSSISFGLAQFLTPIIKKELGVPVIWGGVDTTVNIHENIQYCDMACLGEGEYPIRELVNRMDCGGDITNIPSIWVNQDGRIHQNPVGKLEQNLDNYPFPDYEAANKTVIFDNQILPCIYPPDTHLRSNYMVMATRGCPFSCTYCCSGHYRQIYKGDHFLRRRSVDNVIKELDYRKRTWPWPLERIEVYDDVLPLNHDWLQEFAPRYAGEIGLPFFGYTHPNVGDPKNLKVLKQAGIDYLIMGVQSGSQRVLNQFYNRRHTKKRTIQTARNILDADIKLVCDFIGYNPLINEADNIETLDLICDIPKPWGIIKFNPMAFYDNYRLTEIAKREGIMDQLERPKGVHAWQAKITPELVFWEYILTLGHFNGFSKPHIMDMVNDRYLRENPAVLQQIVTHLYKATYQDSNPVVNKDRFIQQLQMDLARVEGSRVFRAYRKLKSLVA
ncbi:MAG: B12-binding domain-containing radical SAM protein [Candidatus Omnitrophica bacterium]|nr:B12-binding domain-containing radical SAM protein [Candidatus Omnitrophota bacterium]